MFNCLEHFVLRHGAKSPFTQHQSGEKMAHKKLISLAVMVTIFASVGGITWALVNAQQTQDETQLPVVNMPKLRIHEDIRDAAMAYINQQHPETSQFTANLLWTGGKQETKLLGAETYEYRGDAWKVTIQYPVVANPIYKIIADYSASSDSIGIPYRITWQGQWENGSITETNFVFAQ
jgi:hypothetical protein